MSYERRLDRTLPTCIVLLTAPPSTADNWSSQIVSNSNKLEAAEEVPVRYIGPMAGIIVRLKSRQAGNVDELYAALAEELPDDGSRQQFMGELTG